MPRKFSLRSLLVFVTILAIHFAVTKAVVLNYAADDALTYRGVELAFSILTVLPAIGLSAYLVFAMRAPVHGFIILSIITVSEDNSARVGFANLLSLACSFSVACIIVATLLFPNQTECLIRLSGAPLDWTWASFDPDRSSHLLQFALTAWYSVIIGVLWICTLFAFSISVLKVCFALHLHQSGNQDDIRFSRISFAGALLRQESTNHPMERSRG